MEEVVKYYRADRSHCFYTDDWHLYLFANRFPSKSHLGFTVKHRTRQKVKEDNVWKHYSAKVEHRGRLNDNRMGRLEFCFQVHKSVKFNGSRITRSKKYVRFAICF